MHHTKTRIMLGLMVGMLASCSPGSASRTIPTPPPPAALPAPTATLPAPTLTPAANDSSPVISVHMFDEQNGWGSTGESAISRHILHTRDGGLTWKDVTPTHTASIDDGGPFFLDAQNAWLVTGTGNMDTPTIYRTGDGGEHWSPLQDPPFKLPASVSFIDPNHGTAGGNMDTAAGNSYFTLYQTNDGGKSWKPMVFKDPRDIPPERGLPAGAFHVGSGEGFEFRKSGVIWYGGNVLSAEKTITLRVSRDAGRSWATEQITVPESDKVMSDMVTYPLPVFITDRDAYILASYSLPGSDPNTPRAVGALIMTHDGGQTWTASPTLLDAPDWLQFVSPTDAFVRCGQTLCVTYDAAKTWQPVQSNISFAPLGPDQDQVLVGLDFVDTTTGWAEIVNGASYESIKTIDGGLTWTKLSPTIVP